MESKPPPVATQNSRLLAIPGIRNRIYTIAIDDEVRHLELSNLPGLDIVSKYRTFDHGFLKLGTRLLQKKPPHDPQTWIHARRRFLSLTQTCRQLRNEFLPIHQAGTPVIVRLPHFQSYAQTCIAGTGVANVIIETVKSDPNDSCDILLLFSKAPGIKIDWRTPIMGRLRELLSRPHDHPAFCAYVSERVGGVVAVTGAIKDSSCLQQMGSTWIPMRYRVIKRLELDVKNEYAEEWMSELKAQENEEKLLGWRCGLGVEGMDVFPFLRGSDEPADAEVYGWGWALTPNGVRLFVRLVGSMSALPRRCESSSGANTTCPTSRDMTMMASRTPS